MRVTNVARLHQPSTRICKILANCEHALSDCKESNGSNKISLLVKSCSIRACPERVQRVERVKQKSAKSGNFRCVCSGGRQLHRSRRNWIRDLAGEVGLIMSKSVHES